MNNHTLSLEHLLGMDLDDFLTRYWPDTHLVRSGPLDRFGPLAREPLFADVETLTSACPNGVLVVPSAVGGEGYGSGVPVRESDALQLFASGLSIWVRDAQQATPSIRDSQAAIGRALGVDRLSSSLWISPAGARTPLHFDASETFVLQLKGKKRWRIASNAEKYPALDSCFKDTKLDHPITFIMGPGDVSFMPRGTWHAVEAIDDSWSLTFFVFTPSWHTYVAEYLEQLKHEPDWRRPVAAAEFRVRGDTLDAMFHELVDGALRTKLSRGARSELLAELRNRGRSTTSTYQLRGEWTLLEQRVSPKTHGRCLDCVLRKNGGTKTRLRITREMFPFLSGILDESGSFTLDALVAVTAPREAALWYIHGGGKREIHELFQTLQDIGVIAKRRPRSRSRSSRISPRLS